MSAPDPQDFGHLPSLRPLEVRLDAETMDLLRDEMRAASKEAAREGIESLFTEANARRFFKAGVAVVREEAKFAAGDIVLGGVKAFFRRAFWVLVFLGLALYFGGWPLLKAIALAIYQAATGKP
jgi:hypothetical protein